MKSPLSAGRPEEIDASFNTARNKPKGHLRIAIGGSTACDVLIRCWRTL